MQTDVAVAERGTIALKEIQKLDKHCVGHDVFYRCSRHVLKDFVTTRSQFMSL
jgi:hypothetical protein